MSIKDIVSAPLQAWRMLAIRPGQLPMTDFLAMHKGPPATNYMVGDQPQHDSQRSHDLHHAGQLALARGNAPLAAHYALRREILVTSALQYDPHIGANFETLQLEHQAEWHLRGAREDAAATGAKKLYPAHNSFMAQAASNAVALENLVPHAPKATMAGVLADYIKTLDTAARSGTTPLHDMIRNKRKLRLVGRKPE